MCNCEDDREGKPGETVYGRERARLLDLLYNFTYAYDAKDVEAMRPLLTEDAIWSCYLNGSEEPVLLTHERQSVLDWMANRELIMREYGLVSHDLALLPILTWVDQNTVRIKSTTLNFLRSGSKPPRTVQSGTCDSLAVRGADDQWRFSSRVMHVWGRVDPHLIGRTLLADVPWPDEPDDFTHVLVSGNDT